MLLIEREAPGGVHRWQLLVRNRKRSTGITHVENQQSACISQNANATIPAGIRSSVEITHHITLR